MANKRPASEMSTSPTPGASSSNTATASGSNEKSGNGNGSGKEEKEKEEPPIKRIHIEQMNLGSVSSQVGLCFIQSLNNLNFPVRGINCPNISHYFLRGSEGL